jgi:shikimate kinase
VYKKNIALIGMPGSGKSASAEILARKLDMFFLDTDRLIEYESGLNIDEIFKVYGGEQFRKIETGVFRRVSKFENTVFACGGGAVLNKENVDRLKNCAYIIYLKTRPETLLSRLKKEKTPRPVLVALTEDGISGLLEKRKDLYEGAAEIVVDTDNLTPEKVCENIIDKLSAI